MEFNPPVHQVLSVICFSVFSRCSKADAHETGHDLRGEFRQHFDEEVCQTLAEEVDVHELLDDGMGTEAANSEADAAIRIASRRATRL